MFVGPLLADTLKIDYSTLAVPRQGGPEPRSKGGELLFTDGEYTTAAVYSTFSRVPEPTSLTLLASVSLAFAASTSLAALWRGRRRRATQQGAGVNPPHATPRPLRQNPMKSRLETV